MIEGQRRLFDNSVIDNRTRTQRAKDRQRAASKQTFMFSAADLAQPSWQTRQHADGPLLMEREDPRTEEQKDADRMQEAQDQTARLF